MITLTPEQELAASLHDGSRCIVATAGSGKTTTLAVRISRLLASGVADRDVLATTFTEASAQEIKDRIDKFSKRKTAVRSGTIHSFCLELIRANFKLLGYSSAPTVINEFKVKRRVDCFFVEHFGNAQADTAFKNEDFPALVADYFITKLGGVENDRSDALVNKKINPVLTLAIHAFVQSQRDEAEIDFETILAAGLELLTSDPDSCTVPKHIFIDEAQDLSAIQWLLIKKLQSLSKSIDVIGDDDQSIYAWRGAKPAHFISFMNDADQVYKLTNNRRCAVSITQLASQILSSIPANARIAKEITSARTEAGTVRSSVLPSVSQVSPAGVTSEIESIHAFSIIKKAIIQRIAGGEKASEIAIIVRTKRHIDVMESSLLASNIKVKVRGGKSVTTKAEMHFLKNVCDLKSAKVKHPLVEASGALGVSLAAAVKIVGNAPSISSFVVSLQAARINVASKARLEQLIKMTRDATIGRDLFDSTVFKDLATYVISSDLAEMARALGKRGREIAPDDLANMASRQLGTLYSFLNDVKWLRLDAVAARLTATDEEDELQDAVTITTSHSAKGLEWNTVFVMDVANEEWPLKRSLKGKRAAVLDAAMHEEARLLYVAVTRAKNELFLVSLAKRGPGLQRSVSCQFLSESDRAIIDAQIEAAINSQKATGITLQNC